MFPCLTGGALFAVEIPPGTEADIGSIFANISGEPASEPNDEPHNNTAFRTDSCVIRDEERVKGEYGT